MKKLIFIWLLGSIVSYFTLRHVARESGQYTVVDRTITIGISVAFSWLGAVSGGLMILTQEAGKDSEPAKW